MTRAPLPDGLHPLAYRRWKGVAMNAQDIQLERSIDDALRAVCHSVKQNECRQHFSRLRELIKQRRPAVVREMELRKGLVRA